jgi:hypothetical protein
MFAHIGGIPVEESLSWLVPIGSIGLAGSLAWVREHTRSARRHISVPGKRTGIPVAKERS